MLGRILARGIILAGKQGLRCGMARVRHGSSLQRRPAWLPCELVIKQSEGPWLLLAPAVPKLRAKTKVPRFARHDKFVFVQAISVTKRAYRPAARRVARRGGRLAAKMRSCAAFRL